MKSTARTVAVTIILPVMRKAGEKVEWIRLGNREDRDIVVGKKPRDDGEEVGSGRGDGGQDETGVDSDSDSEPRSSPTSTSI